MSSCPLSRKAPTTSGLGLSQLDTGRASNLCLPAPGYLDWVMETQYEILGL